VAVLFGLRHNLPDNAAAEVFGWSQTTTARYQDLRIRSRGGSPALRSTSSTNARKRGGALVDGFGERDGYDGLFSGKKRMSG
jgi:hypothetical protein